MQPTPQRPAFEPHTALMLRVWDRHGFLEPLRDDTVGTGRAPIDDTRQWLLGHTGFHHEDVVAGTAVGDVTLAILRPSTVVDEAPILFFIHGGGLVGGSRFDGPDVVAPIAERHGAIVVSPEYRLAPEHPAPAAVEDCFAALCWVADHASSFGGDPERIIVVGQSAGGGLAVGTALLARDRSGPQTLGVLAMYPMLDDRNDSISARQFWEAGNWTGASNDVAWRAALGDRVGTDDVSQYEAPARATWLGGLPPVYLDVGSCEPFRDEVVALASAIWRDGGDAELHVHPGGTHVSETLSARSWIGRGLRHARDEWAAHLLTPDDPEETLRHVRALGRFPIGDQP